MPGSSVVHLFTREGQMAGRWRRLSPRKRAAVIVAAAVEGVLKIAMLADLRRRPAEQVHGPKWAWAASAVVNSAGLVPLAYLIYGRRRQEPAA